MPKGLNLLSLLCILKQILYFMFVYFRIYLLNVFAFSIQLLLYFYTLCCETCVSLIFVCFDIFSSSWSLLLLVEVVLNFSLWFSCRCSLYCILYLFTHEHAFDWLV